MFTITLVLLILLWGLIIYHHLIYPLMLQKMHRYQLQKNKHAPKNSSSEATLPSICVLIPAYNEAEVIADKISNLACLEYPTDKLKVVIACDGCSDDTADIARRSAVDVENSQLDLTIIELPENRGKVFVLNLMIDALSDDVIALSDASALISIDALSLAAKHFQDSQVAVVGAGYQLLKAGNCGEDAYWQYQRKIKLAEAALGDPIGVHGALYLFRRQLFSPLKADTINDDFILPMSIVSNGYRAVYDSTMIALELEQASRQMDQQRRVRLGAGNLQQLLRLPKLLAPSLGWTAFNFFSGKALRALMPLLILLQLLICLLLNAQSLWLLIFALLQITGFVCAWLSSYLPEHWIHRYLNILFYMANGYRCSLLGTIRYMVGLENGCWKPVSSVTESSK